MFKLFSAILGCLVLIVCSHHFRSLCDDGKKDDVCVIRPAMITQPSRYDTDDPAIWVNPKNPAESLILGTDKHDNGAVYAFDLNGVIIEDKTVRNLKRPNNVDVAYGLVLKGKAVDIAVTTERLANRLRIFSLPYMKPVDNGGVEVFTGETKEGYRAPMGIAAYRRNEDGALFAIVGRKNGPKEGYLWQYLLEDDGSGAVKATLVRKFGSFSGLKEIEAIAVDNALGYVYYSDEGVGIRKYHADPNKGNEELALFATKDFAEDHEGICIYPVDDSTGYILVSDQGAHELHIYAREGFNGNAHAHPLFKVVTLAARECDGLEASPVSFNSTFPNGLVVAMSNNKTFHYYRWEAIAGEDLEVRAGTN